MGFIYKIVNTDNAKVYIGQTRKSVNARWYAHKHAIKSGKGCPLLARAFNSHGADKFSIEMVEECEDDTLCEREVFYIKEFNSLAPHGYNADAGGKTGGTFKGHKHTPETIARWKEKVREQYDSPEYRKARSEIAKAYYANPENRAKQSARMKEVANSPEHAHKFVNRVISDETKEKIREGVNRYYANIVQEDGGKKINKKQHEAVIKANSRHVGRYNALNKLIKTYNSIYEASQELQLNRNTVGRYLSKGTKDNQGYSWKYLDEGSEIANRLNQRNFNREKHSETMTKLNGKKVAKYSFAGKLLCTYNTIKEASDDNNVDSSRISAVTRGKGQTAGGFIWKYADDQGLKDVCQ